MGVCSTGTIGWWKLLGCYSLSTTGSGVAVLRQPSDTLGSSTEESLSSIQSHLKLLKKADELYPKVYILSVHEYPIPLNSLCNINNEIHNI